MGNNLPPGVSPGDPNAPWNAPDPEDYNRCRHCGATVLNHPDDHGPGCEAVNKCVFCSEQIDTRRDHRDGCPNEGTDRADERNAMDAPPDYLDALEAWYSGQYQDAHDDE